jgi:hypothetical protein
MPEFDAAHLGYALLADLITKTIGFIVFRIWQSVRGR